MEEVVVKGYRVPKSLLYTETDEWIRIDGEIAVVGITDYAQKKLKNIIGVELPQRGSRVRKGDSVGVIESIKAVADLYAPVSGEVIEVNERLKEEPELINHEPYSGGWIFKIRLSNKDEVKDLLSYEKYSEKISRE
ncbi:MAG: glycine cleavage system protein GcvH [Desulfurococcales archaeon]|jgi:glycine cleavage system H protein|nr:glycine cleavage system protein GcvH [Desulfurococcales archaeon]